MEEPELVECSDGQFRHAIWGLGANMGDYPEQALLACIVQGWCPRYWLLHHFCSFVLSNPFYLSDVRLFL